MVDGCGVIRIQQPCSEGQAHFLAALGQSFGKESIDPVAAGRIRFSFGERTTSCLQTTQTAEGEVVVNLCAIRVTK